VHREEVFEMVQREKAEEARKTHASDGNERLGQGLVAARAVSLEERAFMSANCSPISIPPHLLLPHFDGPALTYLTTTTNASGRSHA
jgi:hypothetical protein